MFSYRDKSQRRHPLGIIRPVSQWTQDYKTMDQQQSGKIQTTHSSFCCYSHLIFPSQHFQTDSNKYRHSLHMRCHNTPRNTKGNHFHTFTIMRSCHVSACGESRRGSGFQVAQAGGSAQLVWSTAGWEGEPYWKDINDFFLSPSSLKQVKAGPLHLSFPLCALHSLRAPPGRLVLRHYNYLSLLLTHAHTLVWLLGWGSTGHLLFRLCHLRFVHVQLMQFNTVHPMRWHK